MAAVAGEGRLKRLDGLAGPPRVLHLATHGFYLSGAGAGDQPLLLSGLSLAGANRAFGGGGAGDGEEDGILYSLEAQGLNLDGMELAVLSACETGQGSVDYSEGVYGLARALRTAGAGKVLMTLWPVVDGEARDFMVAFYRAWLAQSVSDPAAALRAVKLAYIGRGEDPRTWAPYGLVGG